MKTNPLAPDLGKSEPAGDAVSVIRLDHLYFKPISMTEMYLYEHIFARKRYTLRPTLNGPEYLGSTSYELQRDPSWAPGRRAHISILLGLR